MTRPVYRPETEITLITMVRDRLRQKVPFCTESTCFVATKPVPDVVTTTDPIVTVVLDDSTFDPNYESGGRAHQTKADVIFLVTLATRCVLDSPPKADIKILDLNRGMINYRNAIINALLVSDDSCTDHRSPWALITEDNTYFMRDYGLELLHATGPRETADAKGNNLLVCSVSFKAVMDLSLQWLPELHVV